MRNRTGTILIIVAGVSALLAALGLAFLVRMRADAEETELTMRDSQARIMLEAGCNYVQECSRLGYNNAAFMGAHPKGHREAYGWIDVRDGDLPNAVPGPKDEDMKPCYSTALVEDSNGDGSPDRPAWPAIGGVARCPMYVMKRPPFALQNRACYNPIATDTASPDFGRPYLSHRDPEPAVSDYSQWRNGDRTPRQDSLNLSWFRVLREEASTFIVTCGAGASQGFRDWDEVRGANAEAFFDNDAKAFADIVSHEARLWYRIEWTAAIKDVTYHCLHNDISHPVFDHYIWFPMMSSHEANVQYTPGNANPSGGARTQSHSRNSVGTIRWIQALRFAPTHW